MSFAVFPDPPTEPLTVAAGDITFTPISQLTGSSVPVGAYLKMMFIRVAMSGGSSPPELFVKAGTGSEVKITALTTAVFRSDNPADYVGDVQQFSEANNVYRIRVGFDKDTTEAWQFGIRNKDLSAAREFTWVVADSEAEAAQPWIVVSPARHAFPALVGDSLEQRVQVSNKGTGPLTITAIAPALPVGFTLGSTLPLMVPPSGTAPLTIKFDAPDTPPAPDGQITARIALTATPPDTTASSSAGHNQEVSLTATVQRLEVVLLLDASGSMACDAQGELLPQGSPDSRWSELSSAASQFLDLLAHFGAERGRFGIARFPAADPNDTATFDIVRMTGIPHLDDMATAKAAVAQVNPDGGTPMGDGLDRVLAPATSYFDSDALSVATNRRWLILMSDGAHNSGTHTPTEFIAPATGTAPPGTSMADRRISMFAVGYGIEGFTDVNHVLLKQLCTSSAGGGQHRAVDEEGTTATALAAALRNALKSGLTPTASPRDPLGMFLTGTPEVRHEVVLAQFDHRAALMINWNTPDRGRLRLELLTPLQERITPETAGSGDFSGVTFRGGNRSQSYLFDPRFLSGEGRTGPEGQAPTRRGTWTLIVTAPADIPAPDGSPGAFIVEKYTYDALTYSDLQLSLDMDKTDYFAGDPIAVSARLTAAGMPVTGASVSLSTSVPTQSMANWLSDLDIPAEAMEQALIQLDGLDATPTLIKKRAAKLAGFSFDNTMREVSLQMTEEDGSGVYSATFTNTSLPEHYTFYVTATGAIDDIDFRREAKQETYVLVQPDRDHTEIDIQQTEPGLAEVTVIPRDRFGNVVMIDPQVVGGFGLTATDTQVGEIVSHLDGTYSAPVRYDPVVNPTIGFSFDGVQVTTLKVPSLQELHYPTQVVAFTPGVLSNYINGNPEAVLGTVQGKGPDTFVALGGGGQLVVGFDGDVVLEGSEDVTVFVHPDTDLRAYRVEAFSQEQQEWVTLGESRGVTETFQLSAGSMKSPSLRLTDVSGRTRDSHLNPLATPGVSLRGIGVRKTSGGR
ncbi:VWA domain-containing protein [Streptomyces sp. NBC_00638]|uniref:VWA domain-containing protein n=1 Tax=unclassified Streptomyces TaxID=2593676 RepID=UPI0022592F96|nr:VWA domain-containing protein [Streptomyces sp. NBC_00638]MCX5001197.1 VWA domain-containing protein [Streptomyces sp. NBC_00638]